MLTPSSSTAPGGYDPARDAAGYHYEPDRADRVVEFMRRYIRHVKGALAGHAFEPEPWQETFLRQLFGWVDDRGFRRYRQGLLYVPRKNGKTFIAAGVALYCLMADGEPGAEVYSASSDRKTASLAFEAAKAMVSHSPALASRLKCLRYSIRHLSSMSFYQVLSAEARRQHGGNTHAAIVDEVHTLGQNRELLDVLTSSVGARTQPLILYITTADYMRPSACNEMLAFFRAVRDGTAALPQYLPWIYETMPGEDWQDRAVWRKCNPNLGVSVTEEFLAAELAKARTDPSYENTFRRLYLNQQTEQEVRWMPMECWDACAGGEETPEHAKAGCYVGIDVGEVEDLSAVSIYWPHDHLVKVHLWAPEGSPNARVYEQFARAGVLTIEPGRMLDQGILEGFLDNLSKQCYIRKVGLDPWHSRQLALRLQEKGLPVELLSQGFSTVGEATRKLGSLVLAKELRHMGNPALRWMAANAVVRMSPDGIPKLDKRKSRGKIDGLSAMVNALALSMFDTGTGSSVYAERGLVILGGGA